VTKIEILPTPKVAHAAGEFSVVYDYNFIFDDLLKHYVDGTIIQ
jgi:hypothetical protein